MFRCLCMAGLDHPVRQVFDSNCITPGTEFMAEISKHLRYFIRKKIREDTMWQRLHVILSGHEVCVIGVVAVVAIAASFVGPSDVSLSTSVCYCVRSLCVCLSASACACACVSVCLRVCLSVRVPVRVHHVAGAW